MADIMPPPIHPAHSGEPAWTSRFWSRVELGPNDCWLWTGALNRGYGQVTPGLWGTTRVHRVAYLWVYGSIPDRLVIDHTCHNSDAACAGGSTCVHRRCLNPGHLEAVTDRVNILRGRAPAALHAQAVTCKYGHELTGDNLTRALITHGKRQCRKCQNRRERESYARRKALRSAEAGA